MGKNINNAAVSTNIGNIRSENQDNFYLNGAFCSEKKDNHVSYKTTFKEAAVFAVADGLGGQNFGSFASFKAMEILHNAVGENNIDIDKNIESYVYSVNEALCNKMEETGLKTGTTLVLLSINHDKARVYNVGDSRCYLLRGNYLLRLTKDHTLASELVDMNVLTAEEAERDKRKHQLTQHLGVSQDEMLLSVYKGEPFEIKIGDKFLLCSDGITDVFDDSEILQLMTERGSCKRLANNMVFKALDKKGKDNVTALIVSIGETIKNKRFKNMLWAAALGISAAAGVITGMIINALFP